MIPGTVLFDLNFKFSDNTEGEKIFVVLNNGSDGIYIAVKTTSNGSRYKNVYGCQVADRFPNFFLPQGSCHLPKNTWIQLEEFFEFDASKLMKCVMTNEILRKAVLITEQAIELISCATYSEDITSDQEEILLASIESLRSPE